MKGEKLPIIWKNEVVGSVVDLDADNFDLFGKWLPGTGVTTQAFLTALEEGEQLEVEIGTSEPRIIGTVEFVPDEEIEIKSRPRI